MLDNSRKVQMITNTKEVLKEYPSIKKLVTMEFKGIKGVERKVQKICSGAKTSPLIKNGKELYFKYVE